MSNRTRRTYSYAIDDSLVNRQGPRQRPPRKILRWLVSALLIAAIAGGVAAFVPLHGVVSLLPFPKKLEAVRFQHNGKEVILLPDSQCIVNPRDTLQLLEVQTDGWMSWGTRVKAADIDLSKMRSAPMVIRDLMPEETFEIPRPLDVWVLLWNRPIGKVTFLVQLDAKDWVQKANTVADDDKRLAYLENALKDNPANVLLKTQLAGLYFERKKYDEAAALYKEVNESGQSATILEKLLEVYKTQKKTDEALDTYLDLLAVADENKYFKGMLDYLDKSKSDADAVNFLEKSQNKIPKAFRSSLHLYLADLCSQTKNWSKAANYYEAAVRDGVKDQNVLYNLAVSYQQSGDADKALAAMERYLRANPNDNKSLMQLAVLAEKKGDSSKAREIYERLLRGNPQDREALGRLIAILEKSGDRAGLEAAYERMAQQQPDNKTVITNLALLYYKEEKWDKAARYFEKLEDADPKDLKTQKYLLDIYRKLNNDQAELETLKRMAQIEPRNSSYQEAIFAYYDEKKDYKSITSFFRPLSEQAGDSVQIHSYLLFAALKQGDKAAAAGELEDLCRLQSGEKKYFRQAADLYESMGKFGEASKKYERILQIDPNDKEAKEAYLRLKMKSFPGKASKPEGVKPEPKPQAQTEGVKPQGKPQTKTGGARSDAGSQAQAEGAKPEAKPQGVKTQEPKSEPQTPAGKPQSQQSQASGLKSTPPAKTGKPQAQSREAKPQAQSQGSKSGAPPQAVKSPASSQEPKTESQTTGAKP